MSEMLISEDDFDVIWEPQINPFEDPASASCHWEYAHLVDVPLHQVWSLVDGDDDNAYAIPGYHIVNVWGYTVTARMWTDEEADAGITAVWIMREPEEPDPEEPDDGLVLIAGVLYDRETGQEAETCEAGLHEVDHNECDRDEHLARQAAGEDCPLVHCMVCGLSAAEIEED